MMKLPVYLLLAAVALLPACTKKNDAKPEVIIDAKNLSECTEGYTCQQLFTEQADVDSTFNLKSGTYRLFWYRQERAGYNNRLYIRTPMKGNSFELNGAAIAAGAVTHTVDCPACNVIHFKPVGGLVKGINTTPGNRADQTKWLIEANILMEAAGDASLKDTLYVKQYYYPNFVID